MLTLAAADTLAGVASAASQVTCTIFGMELNGTTETYKVLDQRQLASSAGTIYTAPTSTTAFVRSIHVVNNDTVARTFRLFRAGTAAANAITPVYTLQAGSMAVYEDGLGWQFTTSGGQLLQGMFTPAPPLGIWGISGCKGETLDRNYCTETNTTAGTTGQIRIQAIYLAAGTIVSNIAFASATTAAGTPTHYVFALYDLSGNLLATTADQTSTAWAANTVRTIAVTAAYTVPTSGLYYLAISVVASTFPTLKGNTARTGGQLYAATPNLAGISSTTYSTGTAPATINIPTAASTASIWGAVT